MKLNEKFKHIQEEMAQQLPSDILNIFGKSLQELLAQKLETNALKVGDIAPDFTLLDTNGLPVSLYDVLKDHLVILSFFRGNWCPFCIAELRHYQEAINNDKIKSSTVIAVSPQTVNYNSQVSKQNDLQFKILCDQGNKIAEKYGLVFVLPENVRDLYKSVGADLEIFNNDNTYKLPIPATYVIDQNKKIIFASVDANYMERADVCDIEFK